MCQGYPPAMSDKWESLQQLPAFAEKDSFEDMVHISPQSQRVVAISKNLASTQSASFYLGDGQAFAPLQKNYNR